MRTATRSSRVRRPSPSPSVAKPHHRSSENILASPTSAPEVALVAAECAQIHREHVALLNSACHLLHLLVAGDSTARAMSLGAGFGGRRVAALAQLIRTKRDFRARERGYWETWAKEEEEGDANANLPRGVVAG